MLETDRVEVVLDMEKPGKLKVVIPLMVGMVTTVLMWLIQGPVRGVDGSFQYETELDPHVFIIYVGLSVIITAVFIDFAYWLKKWCKRQCFAGT